MSSESKRLPFEPRQNKKKKSRNNASPENTAKTTSKNRDLKSEASLSAIPDVVSKRMARRMALFCGVPSVLGMSSLFVFYWLSSSDIVDLPPFVALAVSFAFLGLGVGGLSYGIFSASWDETRVGGLIGGAEFKTNVQRTFQAWRENRQQAKNN